MFLTLLSIYERAEMLDQMVILHLIFKKLANFSKAVACFLHSHQEGTVFNFKDTESNSVLIK